MHSPTERLLLLACLVLAALVIVLLTRDRDRLPCGVAWIDGRPQQIDAYWPPTNGCVLTVVNTPKEH